MDLSFSVEPSRKGGFVSPLPVFQIVQSRPVSEHLNFGKSAVYGLKSILYESNYLLLLLFLLALGVGVLAGIYPAFILSGFRIKRTLR
jgi:hypothetical protein